MKEGKTEHTLRAGVQSSLNCCPAIEVPVHTCFASEPGVFVISQIHYYCVLQHDAAAVQYCKEHEKQKKPSPTQRTTFLLAIRPRRRVLCCRPTFTSCCFEPMLCTNSKHEDIRSDSNQCQCVCETIGKRTDKEFKCL